jgi:hypothetical protein
MPLAVWLIGLLESWVDALLVPTIIDSHGLFDFVRSEGSGSSIGRGRVIGVAYCGVSGCFNLGVWVIVGVCIHEGSHWGVVGGVVG